MSGSEPPEATVETTRSLKRKHLSNDQQDDVDKLDKIFKRIKAAVPRVPYILSTPSMDPYRYHSQQEANAWMMGRLWRHDEEHMQYRTYLYREPCQDCFELQAGEEDEPEPQRAKSQASNTGNQAVKKKMNLSAFKVKQANGTVTPGSKVVSPNLDPAKHASEQSSSVKKSEKLSDPAQSKMPKSPKQSSNDPREGQREDKTNHDSPHSDQQQRPLSSPRKSDSSETMIKIDKPNASNALAHGLPPLLSPVHDPLDNPYGLPNILSPTLPSNIQAELDRLEVQRTRAASNASTSSSDRKSTLSVPDARSKGHHSIVKSETRPRSVSLNGNSPKISPKTQATSGTEDTDSSLVVKLKFSKTKAPTVKQILRLPPKRTNAGKQDRQDSSKDPPEEVVPKPADGVTIKKKQIPKVAARRHDSTTPSSTPAPTSSTRPIVTVTKPPEKRLRTDDDVSSVATAKRQKVQSSQDGPVTPARQTVSSPALSNKSSAQKSQSQYGTPKKDPKAIGMLRTNSTESYDATPGRSGATPAGARIDAKAGPTSAPLNGKKQADISLLAQTSMKLNQMGRALKHEATKILTTAGNKLTKQDEKRAAVINLECILSYMAAYYAQDLSLNLRGRAGEVEQTWKTLLPLCLSYARSTKEFKHLDGLRSYLSSVIASAICTHVSQRAANTRPPDFSQDIAHAELAKQHAALAENFALLSDHTTKMHRHYQEARVALPMEDLQSTYRKTYAAREANAKLAGEPEKVSGARMSGPYFLPISTDTTAIQAVRFGLKFLSEYCEKEKLEYSLRVNLDKPE
ncbi:uncharacterized protein K460DRAFT_365890 [Cucurbitaria berberidis CBS 394.84]|uniref:Uncharacterized protein n=1 Tax=Cucurbitaria berberidis CBS 394.84 TaxID=1168544 RepID=A0A9P4L873_9PLEO|nr:uncharacterized protein K460DRAFT_365890 [Cucurbitaria berberidis CBS 394.84]KAF1844958.1 hypothetical protein K460DRAFT_365890 [Cucurbitaria berberidis CBS 394.84]